MPPSADIWTETEVHGGITLREVIPPGPDRERVLALGREHYQSLAATLEPAVEELRAIIAAHEPVGLISSIVIPANMRFYQKHDSFADPTDTASWPAKIEYLVGVTLSVPRGTGATPPAESQRAMDLVSDVFDALQAQQMLDAFQRPYSSNPALDQAMFILRIEHLFDRMPGYVCHLERINAEIFDPHRRYYIETIGFNPADVIRAVRRRISATQARVRAAWSKAQRLHRHDPHTAKTAVGDMLQAMTDSRTWHSDDVARDAQMDAEQVGRMLAFFSTTFGAQPEFRLPTDRNLARTYPAIDLGSGTYFVPDPWTLAAAVHDRLAQLSAADGLLQRYRAHREQGHQRLVGTVLRDVFPDGLVAERQHYISDTDGPGEIDAVVTVEWPLIVEAKAHGLTESGRRGAPARVERVAGDLIEKALEQTRRAVTYIIDEGKREFANKQGAPVVRVLPANITGATEIIVTFERIDPLAMLGPMVVEQESRPVWVVSIADFLMVAEILNDPSELHHYARTRANTVIRGPLVYMESDALGGYLVDRLRIPAARATEQPQAILMLGYSSEAINDYFTANELGVARPKPTAGVASEVLSALAKTMTLNTGLWARTADAVMGAPPDAWRRWRKYRRRHHDPGRFALTPNLHLLVGTDASLTTEEEVLVLRFAAASATTKPR
jgi:hypothetical protein